MSPLVSANFRETQQGCARKRKKMDKQPEGRGGGGWEREQWSSPPTCQASSATHNHRQSTCMTAREQPQVEWLLIPWLAKHTTIWHNKEIIGKIKNYGQVQECKQKQLSWQVWEKQTGKTGQRLTSSIGQSVSSAVLADLFGVPLSAIPWLDWGEQSTHCLPQPVGIFQIWFCSGICSVGSMREKWERIWLKVSRIFLRKTLSCLDRMKMLEWKGEGGTMTCCLSILTLKVHLNLFSNSLPKTWFVFDKGLCFPPNHLASSLGSFSMSKLICVGEWSHALLHAFHLLWKTACNVMDGSTSMDKFPFKLGPLSCSVIYMYVCMFICAWYEKAVQPEAL